MEGVQCSVGGMQCGMEGCAVWGGEMCSVGWGLCSMQ